MSRRRRRDIVNAAWAAQMLASYRALNPEQAGWFDGAGASAQTELLARLQPGGYLEATFGPRGQNRSRCDFLYLLRTSGNIVSRANSKTGATLRWNIDGAIYSQNDLPAHTLGTGAGIVTVSSLDGWARLASFAIDNNQFSGVCPNFNFPSVTQFRIQANQFSGVCPNFNFPAVTIFFINNNQFSGSCPNFNFPNIAAFYIHANQFSGSCPNFNFPNITVFYIHANQFSGSCPNFNFPNITVFWINNNQLSSIPGTLNFITGTSNLKDIRFNSNQLPQADVDRLLAAYHTHRAYYAGLTGNLTFSLQTGNAAPSATGATHRTEIINAFTAQGRTATITTS